MNLAQASRTSERPCRLRLTALPRAMLGDLGPIAADRHAAPAAAMGLTRVEKPQRAAFAFAPTDIGKVSVANQIGECMSHRLQAFYAALGKGDAPAALGLMADDIEWTTMWHYKVDGRGPQNVAEGVLVPLTKEWSEFRMDPTEFIAQGDSVVSLGRFVATHRTTRKKADAGYAHVWTVKDGRIARFRQYIDTLAVADARR